MHAARPDIRCAIYVGCSAVVAVSTLKVGLLPLTQDAAVLGEVSLHRYTGGMYFVYIQTLIKKNSGNSHASWLGPYFRAFSLCPFLGKINKYFTVFFLYFEMNIILAINVRKFNLCVNTRFYF